MNIDFSHKNDLNKPIDQKHANSINTFSFGSTSAKIKIHLQNIEQIYN